MDNDLFKYFMDQTNSRFDNIEKKLDKLLEFKWQIIGGAGLLSIIITILINLFAGALSGT